MKVIFFANTDWYLYNFRLDFALTLKQAGYEVVLLTPEGPYRAKLQEAGFRWLEIPLTRRGLNPFREIFSVWRLFSIYGKEKPDIVHHYTIKCVVYGSTTAHLRRIKKIVNSITGLGYVFLGEDWQARSIRKLAVAWYKLILRGTSVIFLNRDDLAYFIHESIIRPQEAVLIAGDGVNTDLFTPGPTRNPDIPLVVLVCRMLFDKGVGEYVEAARRLKAEGCQARFALIGNIDLGNPTGISSNQLDEWQQQGIIEWWGWRDNMREVYQQADIACLPSYREGLPKMLIEAGACGLPLVATDVPGCRDVVYEGENGFLVKVRDADSLAEALKKLITNAPLRIKMGGRSREIVVKQFALKTIIKKTLVVYEK